MGLVWGCLLFLVLYIWAIVLGFDYCKTLFFGCWRIRICLFMVCSLFEGGYSINWGWMIFTSLNFGLLEKALVDKACVMNSSRVSSNISKSSLLKGLRDKVTWKERFDMLK